MNVTILGGSGFIGNKFASMFRDRFNELNLLNSKNAPLDD